MKDFYTQIWSNPNTKLINGYIAHGFVLIGIVLMIVGFTNSSGEKKLNSNNSVASVNDEIMIIGADTNHAESKLVAVDNLDKDKRQMLIDKQNNTVSEEDFFDIDFESGAPDTVVSDKYVAENHSASNSMIDKINNQHSSSSQSTIEKINRVTSSTPKQNVSYQQPNQPIQQPQYTEPTNTKKRRSITDQNSSFGYGYSSSNSSNTNDITAVIHNGSKEVRPGSRVTIRITQSCVINGVNVPKNTMASGIASFSNERVKISISSLRVGSNVVPVNLVVYELDGIEGIYVPKELMNDIAEDSKQEGINKTGTTINIPVVGSITTDALTKKNKDNSVIIKDGHKITLRIKQ